MVEGALGDPGGSGSGGRSVRDGAGGAEGPAAPAVDAEGEPRSFQIPEKYDHSSLSEETPLIPGKLERTRVFESLGIGDPLSTLEAHLGLRFMGMLSIAQHVLKGFGQSFTQPARRYMFSEYKVGGPQMQIYISVAMLPWAMKPVIGVVSDFFPIGGYHKLPYMFLASVIGIIACGALGTTTPVEMSVVASVMCCFCIELMISLTDLLTEAKYAEKIREQPILGPALASFVWFGINTGALVAVASVGFVMDRLGVRAPFLLAMFPMSLIFLPVLRNHVQDRPRSDEDLTLFRQRMVQQKEIIFLCVVMFFGTTSLTVTGVLFESTVLNGTLAIVIMLVMLLSFSFVLRPIIAKVNAWFLIQSSLCLSVEGATFYFYTDNALAYPEGPHFSMQFYVSVLGIVGTICSLFGIWTYHRFATVFTYRQLLITTNIIMTFLCLLDLILFTRANVKIGIPDHFFVIGSSVFETMIRQWLWIPGVVLNSQLCPHGMEATMYALLAGCHNLGAAVSQNCGALLLQYVGCAPNGSPKESHQFENLWIAALTSTVLPALSLILLPFLIPDAKQTDKLLADEDCDASEGSLYRRWFPG